jgi:hypothetical protein
MLQDDRGFGYDVTSSRRMQRGSPHGSTVMNGVQRRERMVKRSAARSALIYS